MATYASLGYGILKYFGDDFLEELEEDRKQLTKHVKDKAFNYAIEKAEKLEPDTYLKQGYDYIKNITGLKPEGEQEYPTNEVYYKDGKGYINGIPVGADYDKKLRMETNIPEQPYSLLTDYNRRLGFQRPYSHKDATIPTYFTYDSKQEEKDHPRKHYQQNATIIPAGGFV